MTDLTDLTDLTELTAVEAAAALSAGELSPVELTEAYLQRIGDVNPQLNAYATLTPERARDDARRAADELTRGERRGALHGLPIGLKDLFDTAGVETAAGSALLRGRVPREDSAVAAAMRTAGTVLLGKHTTHEFAWGGTTNNEHYGPTRNPFDPERVPGGSSGGSAAAVTSRMALLSVGTDTCGSVRIPASLSGCIGFKPTFGAVSMHGTIPLSPSLDHAGPITRTVADAVLTLDTLAGRTADLDRVETLLGASVSGRRVARLRGWFEAILDPAVRQGLDDAADALREAGCRVDDLDTGDLGPVVDHVFALVGAEGEPYHRHAFATSPEKFGAGLSEILRAGEPSAQEVRTARAALADIVALLGRALADHDGLLAATTPAAAPRIGEEQVSVDGHEMHVEWMLTRLTSIFDVAGTPALSVPSGRTGEGLPVAVQVVGRRGDEDGVAQLAAVVEAARLIG
jgi:aspartyl-tRNA(Asn)/glutamyl-tRNA(Gln) amidotransferase subunit A